MGKLRRAFGRNVRRLRAERECSQEDLAHQAKLHTTYLSGIENGHRNPTLDVVERIAAALQVRPADLLMDDAT